MNVWSLLTACGLVIWALGALVLLDMGNEHGPSERPRYWPLGALLWPLMFLGLFFAMLWEVLMLTVDSCRRPS